MMRTANIHDLEQLISLLHQISPPTKKELKTDKKVKQILGEMILDRNYIISVYQEKEKLLGTATLLTQLNFSHERRP